jgi:hypothetical protein
VNSAFIGVQRLSNHRSFPGQTSIGGYTVLFGQSASQGPWPRPFPFLQGPTGTGGLPTEDRKAREWAAAGTHPCNGNYKLGLWI